MYILIMEWVKIEGYENYSININSEVRNDKSERILKTDLKQGYFYVILSKNNKKKHFYIHRLIGKYFIENPNNYLLIDHKNGNKTDNSIENLRWCDRSQNGRNRKEKENTSSKYRGVCFFKQTNKWQSSCSSLNGINNYIGLYNTELEAAEAYNTFIKANHLEDFNNINIL